MSAPWKILVVEDENIVAMDLRTSLIASGYEVTDTVGTAGEAIDSAQRRKPDLVLMDISRRGGMDGVADRDVARPQLSPEADVHQHQVGLAALRAVDGLACRPH